MQLHSISVRQAHISAIEASHDQDKRCKDTMKNDRNCAAEPALIWIEAHAQNITNNHPAEVHTPEYHQIPAETRAEFNKITRTSVKIQIDFAE